MTRTISDPTVHPRLAVELVPESCWYSNVRSEVDPSQWDVIRKAVYRDAGYRCEICGGVGDAHPVECHEMWRYDDDRLIQRLVRMLALCPACHRVKHLGLSMMNGDGDAALSHLRLVNGWADADVDRYLERVESLWAWRSQWEWELDLSGLDRHLGH